MSPRLLECRDLNEAFGVLVDSAPNRKSVSQAVLFERIPSGDFLSAAGSQGLTDNLERFYASLPTTEATPITACYWAGTPFEGTLMDVAAKYPNWAPYYDEYLSEGQYVLGRVLAQPLAVRGVRVGVIFLLVLGHDPIDALKVHLENSTSEMSVLVASEGYCRMWDPAHVYGVASSGLSLRDRLILLKVEQRLTNRQVALQVSERLGESVSESLVRNSLTRIFRILGASNRVDAARKARLRGDLAGLR